ncbi:MAG: polysaccharide deacetylase family protein [Sphingomonadaceae bacterium]
MTMRIVMVVLALLITFPASAHKRIALTFDDVPRSAGAFFTPDDRTWRLIAALKAAKVKQAAFFLNPGRLAEPDGKGGEARIAAYVGAGHVIANHSFSHQHLSLASVDNYLADIDKATIWLKGRKGYRPWFRFPYLDEGADDKVKRDAIRAGLRTRGLRNGYVTAESSDWNMENLAKNAVAAGKSLDMAALRDYYVKLHVEAADFYDGLARKTIGRSPAHVMLLHETDIAALYIGDLVAALRKDGWEIVTADKAYADPIGKAMPDVPSAQGTLIEAMAWQKNLPAPRWYKYNDVKLANTLFSVEVLKETPKP